MLGDAVEAATIDLAQIKAEELQVEAHAPPEKHEAIHRDRSSCPAHQPFAEAESQHGEQDMTAPDVERIDPEELAHQGRKPCELFLPSQYFWNPKTGDAENSQRASPDDEADL